MAFDPIYRWCPTATDQLSVGNQLIASHMIPLIAFTILYYDYILTLADEIEFIWPPQNRVSLISVLYLINRYLVLGGHAVMVLYVFMFPVNESRCHSIYRFHQPFAGVVQLLILILCVLRVSAMYNNKRSVLWTLNLLVAVCIGGALYAIFAELDSKTYVLLDINGNTEFPGCNAEIPEASSRRLSIPWSALLVFDFTVFSFTLFKALSIGFQHPIRLMTVLLCDGSIYFIVLFAANLANVLMLIVGISTPISHRQSLLNILQYAPSLLKNANTIVTNILSSTLIARLMLNLRAEGRKQLGLASTNENSIPTIEFNPQSNLITPAEHYELT
ncbi:hypothetical protein BT96DRAFT_1020714 [Gymnopus androsaceus JB14]|uniref:DUF6533 domain-containing protein n=1 Tax=Gymnopus androsaceus JB14 TaxID=1447944 RepID=A0A6A4HG71_9AGAR|nr:hypothetical protein BT96DRAFT_1020714 [Gymnopus androsaceus JB14]